MENTHQTQCDSAVVIELERLAKQYKMSFATTVELYHALYDDLALLESSLEMCKTMCK